MKMRKNLSFTRPLLPLTPKIKQNIETEEKLRCRIRFHLVDLISYIKIIVLDMSPNYVEISLQSRKAP